MEEMQNTSEFSWIEVQFLKKAVTVLLQSRVTLQWTYCFAFYLLRNNATELFEDNQRDLEMAVETLSGLLETPLDPSKSALLKQQILDKTAYVNSRREVLLSDTSIGLAEKRWDCNILLNLDQI
jgi:ariadne-1